MLFSLAAACACTRERASDSQQSLEATPKSRERPAPAPAPEPEPEPEPKFQLVAYRSGDIRLRRAWDDDHDEHVMLAATLPYMIGEHGVETPAIYEGLRPPDRNFSSKFFTDMAGVFRDADAGWLSLQGDWEHYETVELPLNYEWRAGGWQLRERGRGMTQVHFAYLSRGSTVFAETRDIRFAHPTQLVVDRSTLRSAGAPRLVRIHGELPVPQLPVNQLYRITWATTATGGLYVIEIPERLGNDRRRIELLDWAPTASRPRATPLPDVVGFSDAKRFESHIQVKAIDDGVLISGNLRIADHPTPVAYLAVGPPDALIRLPLECEDGPCTGALTSVEVGPDQDYWLAMDGGLYSRDARGRVHALASPKLDERLELAELCWSGSGWATVNETSAWEGDAKLEQIERVGDDLWLRVVVEHGGLLTFVALFKTGRPVSPVHLPCDDCIYGELVRRASDTRNAGVGRSRPKP
ncbi:MAG: hypothetical protein R6X02_33315 [Enhygromyxa sp.]